MEISTQKGYGLTQNGNQYKKCNTAKIAGGALGATTALAFGLSALNDVKKGKCKSIYSLKEIAGNIAINSGIYAAIGTATGAIIDHFINNNRKQEADGAAIQKQKLNTQV